MKLWSGRFEKNTDQLVDKLNASIAYDQRMYREDITGSMPGYTHLQRAQPSTFAHYVMSL